ncbi:hypothetical protein M0804_007885 [Polistes exclamans]|nr:hypothetical protein M0804_007885 [Polistes exclamans]
MGGRWWKSGRDGARAFIAYGSAKHLWNNGAAQVHRCRRKTKVFNARVPQDEVLLHTTRMRCSWPVKEVQEEEEEEEVEEGEEKEEAVEE